MHVSWVVSEWRVSALTHSCKGNIFIVGWKAFGQNENECVASIMSWLQVNKWYRYESFNLFISLVCLARCPSSWMHYREVYKLSWLERFKFRIGLVMASNVQPWWTSGSWKRSQLMKMSTVFYKLMDRSYICSARMAFTKWALATVELSGYVCVLMINIMTYCMSYYDLNNAEILLLYVKLLFDWSPANDCVIREMCGLWTTAQFFNLFSNHKHYVS